VSAKVQTWIFTDSVCIRYDFLSHWASAFGSKPLFPLKIVRDSVPDLTILSLLSLHSPGMSSGALAVAIGRGFGKL
jgi:hypothetical protein